MSGPALDFAPLQTTVQLLRDSNIEADTDPSALNLPGVWVTLDRFRTTSLAGNRTMVAALYLVTADADYDTAMTKLADLYNRVAAAGISPDGDVVAVPVQLQGSGGGLPGLRMPLNLYT